MERTALPKNLRILAEFLVVGICTLAFVLTALGIGSGLLLQNAPGTRDSIEYWAAGQQLVHHADPYDSDAILALERSAGFTSNSPPLVMPNPPIALPLVFPLGFLSPRSSELLWSLILFLSFIASVRMVWVLHGAPANHLYLLGYAFGPALVCLAIGQVSILVLLGLVLFLRLHRSSPFLAGASLWLCLLKPHLFLPFGVALLVWIVASGAYRLVLGTASALAVSAVAGSILDPSAWTQYGRMMHSTRLDTLPVPCVPVALSRAINPDTAWLQYLPAALGCIWALDYFRRHRNHWDWLEHGSPLVLVSVLVAPYSWLTDQAILLPALLHGVYVTRSRILVSILALASASIGIAPLRTVDVLHSASYLWTAPAWLAWYLCATLLSKSKRESGAILPVETGERFLSGVPTPEARKG
jgi:hypothetical protein